MLVGTSAVMCMTVHLVLFARKMTFIVNALPVTNSAITCENKQISAFHHFYFLIVPSVCHFFSIFFCLLVARGRYFWLLIVVVNHGCITDCSC